MYTSTHISNSHERIKFYARKAAPQEKKIGVCVCMCGVFLDKQELCALGAKCVSFYILGNVCNCGIKTKCKV